MKYIETDNSSSETKNLAHRRNFVQAKFLGFAIYKISVAQHALNSSHKF